MAVATAATVVRLDLYEPHSKCSGNAGSEWLIDGECCISDGGAFASRKLTIDNSTEAHLSYFADGSCQSTIDRDYYPNGACGDFDVEGSWPSPFTNFTTLIEYSDDKCTTALSGPYHFAIAVCIPNFGRSEDYQVIDTVLHVCSYDKPNCNGRYTCEEDRHSGECRDRRIFTF